MKKLQIGIGIVMLLSSMAIAYAAEVAIVTDVQDDGENKVQAYLVPDASDTWRPEIGEALQENTMIFVPAAGTVALAHFALGKDYAASGPAQILVSEESSGGVDISSGQQLAQLPLALIMGKESQEIAGAYNLDKATANESLTEDKIENIYPGSARVSSQERFLEFSKRENYQGGGPRVSQRVTPPVTPRPAPLKNMAVMNFIWNPKVARRA